MTLSIVPNFQSTWYDPGRISGDPIITQNVNYSGGANTLRSTSKTSYRLLQDMLKRMFGTNPRQGLGVGLSSPDLTVEAGDATINGRWIINSSQATFDASVLANDTYYLILELTEDTESANRDPQNETVDLVAESTTGYTSVAEKLVIAKFSVAASVPTLIETYTGTPAQISAAAIVPPTSPDGSVYGSVEFYSGAVERHMEAVAEPDGFRITEKLIIDDTDGTPVGKTHLRTINQELEARNDPAVDNDYVPFHSKSLKINGTEVLNAAKELINITLLNTKTIPVGSSELLDRDTAPASAILNKSFQDSTTLIVDNGDPTKKIRFEVSGVTPGATRVLTAIDEDVVIVGRDNIQTITNKKLQDSTTTIIDNADPNKAIRFEVSGISTGTTRVLTPKDGDMILVGETNLQIMSNKTLTSPTVNTPTITAPNIAGDQWNAAQHTHAADINGGQLSPTSIFAGNVPVSKGGTGVSTFTDGGILIGNAAGNVVASARPTSGQIIIGQVSGDPLPKTISGDITIDADGVATYGGSIDAYFGFGSGNAQIHKLTPVLDQNDWDFTADRIYDAVNNPVIYFHFTGIPLKKGTKRLKIANIYIYIYLADTSNFVTTTILFRRNAYNDDDVCATIPTNFQTEGFISVSATSGIFPLADDNDEYILQLQTSSQGLGNFALIGTYAACYWE